jgi:hypothetical protein
VRNLCLFVVAALALGSPGPAPGQAFPPDKLLGGDVRLAVQKVQFGGSCYINRGSSVFKGMALVQSHLTEIVDSAIWELRGQAVLTIATATSGTIHFKQAAMVPAAVHTPLFVNYTQTYDPVGLRLVVTFSIAFPDCTLPVFAVFDAA